MAELNTTINRLIVLKTYNQSNIEKFSRYSVRIRHSDKCVKCRFLVVPGNGPALFGMPDIELLSMIRVMCETIDNKINDKRFDAQTRYAADSQNCSTNRDPQTKSDADNAHGDKTNTLDYLSSSTNKTQISDCFHSSGNKETNK